MGRPSTDTEAITLRLPRETLEMIDDYRRSEVDVPTRPEAVRRIIAEWKKVIRPLR